MLESRGAGFPGAGVLALAGCSICWLSNHVSKVSPPHFYSKGDHRVALEVSWMGPQSGQMKPGVTGLPINLEYIFI